MDYIKVYRFHNAPQELKDLSINGGDEDWIAVVPEEIYNQENQYIGWIESNGFGCCCVDEYDVGDDIIFIGSHG